MTARNREPLAEPGLTVPLPGRLIADCHSVDFPGYRFRRAATLL